MKKGLFFGSFNPIHTGHLIIANHLLNETDLDQIYLVLSPQNPFKTNLELLDEYKRLELVKQSIIKDPRIIVSDVEFHLPRPSYTINTLSFLKQTHPGDDFLLIMGSDSFNDLDKWKDFKSIIDSYKILVYRRPGFELDNQMNAEIEYFKDPLLDISSTAIRELIGMGKSIRYLVPEKVREEIEKNGYYKK